MHNNPRNAADFASQLEREMINSYTKNREASFIDIPCVNKIEGDVAVSKSAMTQLAEKNHKLESLLNLYSDLYRLSGKAEKIDEQKEIDGKTFFDRYYFPNKPVILTSMMQDWPALKKWKPDFFLTEYGHVPIEITKGREKNEAYEKNFRKTITKMPFGEFIELIQKNPVSNDSYLVARNYFFSNPHFHSLRDDVMPPSQIIDTNYAGLQGMKLWFGPSGTVTPLHHDKHSILFCQIYGKKHFKMIPSFELPKIYNTHRYYSDVDPDNVDFDNYPMFKQASVVDVVVKPGHMLFIPAGWWHWVKSLDVSISVTFSNFKVTGNNTLWNCD